MIITKLRRLQILFFGLISLGFFSAAEASLVFVTDTGGTPESAFQIDSEDASTDFIDLEFGASLDAKLRFDVINDKFRLNRATDFGGNQIENVRVENLASAPTCDGAATGRVYFNTTDSLTYICNGATWEPLGTSGGTVNTDLKAALYSESLNTNINATTTDNLIPWNVETFEDDAFVHDTVTNNSRIEVVEAGRYLVSGAVSVSGSNARYNGKLKFRLNGVTVLDPRFQPGYTRDASGQDETSLVFSLILDLAANDYFEILVDQEGGSGAAVTMNPNESTLSVVQLKAPQAVAMAGNANPFITSGQLPAQPSTTQTITINGTGFSPISTVSIPGFPGTINSTTVVSPTQIDVNITTTATETTYDLVVDNDGADNTVWTGNGSNLLNVELIAGTGSAGTYTESFETNFGSWTDSGFAASWTRNSGGTGSAGTGPNSASDGADYIYTEASTPNYPSVAFGIETTDFRVAQSLAFDYHMFGDSMGTLEIQYLRTGVWTTIDIIDGEQQAAQGDPYLNRVIDLTPYPVEGLRFLYTSGNNFTGDCAIDNVVIISS